MQHRHASQPVAEPRQGDPFISDRRACERTPVSRVVCDAGGIIDLSPRGMRILAEKSWLEGVTRPLTLTDGPHSVTIEARCIWCRPDADRHFAVGLAFENVQPEQEGMILRFAAEHAG